MRGNQSEATHARMLELIEQIKKADTAYYRDDRPILSDREYDLLVEKLEQMERDTGLVLSGSPTQTVGGEILEELMAVRHTKPMLSRFSGTIIAEQSNLLRFSILQNVRN